MVGQIDCSPWQSDSLSVPRHGCYNDHQASVPFTIRTGSLSRRSADHACLLNLTINFNLPLRFFHHTDREKSHVMASFSLAPIPMYRVDSGEEPHSGSILPPLALSKTRFKTRKTAFLSRISCIALTPLPRRPRVAVSSRSAGRSGIPGLTAATAGARPGSNRRAAARMNIIAMRSHALPFGNAARRQSDLPGTSTFTHPSMLTTLLLCSQISKSR